MNATGKEQRQWGFMYLGIVILILAQYRDIHAQDHIPYLHESSIFEVGRKSVLVISLEAPLPLKSKVIVAWQSLSAYNVDRSSLSFRYGGESAPLTGLGSGRNSVAKTGKKQESKKEIIMRKENGIVRQTYKSSSAKSKTLDLLPPFYRLASVGSVGVLVVDGAFGHLRC
jgi:hypothetical protein